MRFALIVSNAAVARPALRLNAQNFHMGDFVEFLTAKTFASATSSREALGYLFDLYDDNQKGRLDHSEFVALVTNMAGNAWMTETVSFWGALKLTRKLGLAMSPYVKGNKLEKEQFITECEKNPIIKDMFETEPN
ncbi:unnamed protein product [Rotaria magnacalcarata]|nr:unnamed protein product [Rotaria magnacalcarata]CAF5072901.1 unnamed protein product [Rotaria magnacalcarata]CAF5180436.1 unnamed protein product [Rotaria magnacalcarata]